MSGNNISVNLTLIEKCPEEQRVPFIHLIIDQLVGKTGPRYQEYAKIWSLEEWWEINDSLKLAAKLIVKHNWSEEQITKNITQFHDGQFKVVSETILIRKDEIRRFLHEKTAEISSSTLSDFDWKVKLVLSSSKLVNINVPLCSFDFYTTDADGKKKVTSVEMDVDEIKTFIAKLEGAHKVVQQLTT